MAASIRDRPLGKSIDLLSKMNILLPFGFNDASLNTNRTLISSVSCDISRRSQI